jgi:hypothetical protein
LYRGLRLIHAREDTQCEWLPSPEQVRLIYPALVTIITGQSSFARHTHDYGHLLFFDELPMLEHSFEDLERKFLQAIPPRARLVPLYACLSVCSLEVAAGNLSEAFDEWSRGLPDAVAFVARTLNCQ